MQNVAMTHTELKAIVARHYSHATEGQGQFLHGDFFTPKTKDSLQYLVDEFNAELEKGEDENETLQRENDDLEERITELEKEAAKA